MELTLLVTYIRDIMRLTDPNVVTKQMGRLKINQGLKTVKYLPRSCSAMDAVSRSEYSNKILGKDDYTSSFSSLMDAYDTFFKEFHKYKNDQNANTGNERFYNLLDPLDLTVFLLWQVRNIDTHGGDVFDEMSASKINGVIESAMKQGIEPLIAFPTIQKDQRFSFSHEEYIKVKHIIFDYFGKLIPRSDLLILNSRSSKTNYDVDLFIIYEVEGRRFQVKYTDLIRAGKEPTIREDGVVDEEEYVVDWNPPRMIFIHDGVYVPIYLLDVYRGPD